MGQQPSENKVLENPFVNKNPITTPEMLHMFYGREAQLRQLYQDLARRQSVSVIGPRKIGKTSFLWCACQPTIQERFNEDLHRHLFVGLDLRESLYQTADDFFHRASDAILRQGKLRGLNLISEGSGADGFLSLVDQVFDKGFKLVLLLDSFETIARNPHIGPEFLSFLRSQSSNGKVTYVTATVEPLYELSHKGIKDSPFFNIFGQIKLTGLTRLEAQQLIRELSGRAGLAFTDEEVELVVKYAGVHPCFILRASAILFDLKLQGTNQQVLREHFIKETYTDLKPLLQDAWERLSSADQADIREKVQKNVHEQRFPELTESLFFRKFVASKGPDEAVKELEEALKNMQKLAELGKTSLGKIKVVRYRLNGNVAPTPAELGKVIRDVLYEAFDRLKGSGIRTDEAQDWLSYNILDYRYFSRYRLKHREIAARLEFTNDRQYFRKHNAALAELYNILVEM